MSNVYLGLGSNVDERENYLNNAIKLIHNSNECTVNHVSSFYESTPYGKIDQSNFINSVIEIDTNLEPTALFEFVKKVEVIVGRIKRERWGPREIDIDILFYDDLILDSKEITIPHSDLTNRGFVLLPLLELNPEMIHIKTKKLLKDYLDTIKENDILRIWKNDFIETLRKHN